MGGHLILDRIFHTTLPHFVTAAWALGPDMASAPTSRLKPWISLYMPKKTHKTHCKEAQNLRTALFHGLYFQISYICLGLYGFRDHPRIQSDSGGPQMTSRLGLRSAYYQKPPQKIIKIDEKKWEF